jgi:hypothetical protein
MSKLVSLRLAALVACAVSPFGSGTAPAQETSSFYVNCEYRFAAIFMNPPMTRDTSYATHTGATVPARQFYNERGADKFTVTIVKFPSGPAVDETILDHAADNLRKRGEVRFEAADIYDPGMPGRQLNIFEPNGRQLRASVYMAEHHLTITEATAAVGDFDALQFEQSITLIDGEGYDRDQNVRRGEELKRFECR